MTATDTASQIEARIREALEPSEFTLQDDSAKHAGHRGNTGGGGHYIVRVVSAQFEGLGLVDRHRRVYDAVGDLMGSRIHALALKTLAPSEL